MKFIIRERDTRPVNKKEKIYITGNWKDGFLMERIVQDLVEIWDCKTYVDARVIPGTETLDNESGAEAVKDCQQSMDEMDLVVLVVTKNFLRESSQARDVEYPYLKANHKKVLPVLMEPGLEREFDSVCENLQLLYYDAVDYKKQLETFLYHLFEDADLKKQVQGVFSGSIFLSYRKKDRAHIIRLMELIQQWPGCQDISIWYDDFLTIGEDYDDEIDGRLRESDLFVLAVTPSILEDGNYVMDIEYPRAVALAKKIIPVELADTDMAALKAKFPDLPECIRISEIMDLEQRLLEEKQHFASAVQLSAHEREYLLGAAYLLGIGTRKNEKLGISYLSHAVDGGSIKAANMLSRFYVVSYRDEIPERIKWLEKYADLARQGVHREQNFQWRWTLATALVNLADGYMLSKQNGKARETLLELVEVSTALWTEGAVGTATNPGNVWCRLGMIAAEEGDIQSALQYYAKGEEILSIIYHEMETAESTKGYARVLMAQGDVWLDLFREKEDIGFLQNVVAYYEKAKSVQERYVQVYRKADGAEALATLYFYLGAAYDKLVQSEQNPDRMMELCNQARDNYWDAYQLREVFPQGAEESLYGYGVQTTVMGELYEWMGDLEAAKQYYAEAYRVHKDLYDRRKTEEDYQSFVRVAMNLIRINGEG